MNQHEGEFFIRLILNEENYVEKQMNVVSVRLIKNAPMLSDKPITGPEDAVKLLGNYMCELDREVICVINMPTDGMPMNCNFVSMGSVNECMAHRREKLEKQYSIQCCIHDDYAQSSLGKFNPSKQDTIMTDRMLKLGELMGIPLMDHVIVGGDNKSYFSFKEKDMLEFTHNGFKQL